MNVDGFEEVSAASRARESSAARSVGFMEPRARLARQPHNRTRAHEGSPCAVRVTVSMRLLTT